MDVFSVWVQVCLDIDENKIIILKSGCHKFWDLKKGVELYIYIYILGKITLILMRFTKINKIVKMMWWEHRKLGNAIVKLKEERDDFRSDHEPESFVTKLQEFGKLRGDILF